MNAAAPPVSIAPERPAAAGVAVAGVAAAVAPPPATVRCENCGAAVAHRYCGACGQRLEPPVHSLWHFSRVAAEDLTHADSRLWRTLAARPGETPQQRAERLCGDAKKQQDVAPPPRRLRQRRSER
jgi:hypothetical protein